jgi:hypothetical protein
VKDRAHYAPLSTILHIDSDCPSIRYSIDRGDDRLCIRSEYGGILLTKSEFAALIREVPGIFNDHFDYMKGIQ